MRGALAASLVATRLGHEAPQAVEGLPCAVRSQDVRDADKPVREELVEIMRFQAPDPPSNLKQCRLLPKPGCKGIGYRQISLKINILYHK